MRCQVALLQRPPKLTSCLCRWILDERIFLLSLSLLPHLSTKLGFTTCVEDLSCQAGQPWRSVVSRAHVFSGRRWFQWGRRGSAEPLCCFRSPLTLSDNVLPVFRGATWKQRSIWNFSLQSSFLRMDKGGQELIGQRPNAFRRHILLFVSERRRFFDFRSGVWGIAAFRFRLIFISSRWKFTSRRVREARMDFFRSELSWGRKLNCLVSQTYGLALAMCWPLSFVSTAVTPSEGKGGTLAEEVPDGDATSSQRAATEQASEQEQGEQSQVRTRTTYIRRPFTSSHQTWNNPRHWVTRLAKWLVSETIRWRDGCKTHEKMW